MTGKLRPGGVVLLTFALLIFCGLIAAAWCVFISDDFRIKTVDVRGNAFLTESDMDGILAGFHLEGRHTWFTNFEEIAENIARDPRIESAAFERESASTVRLVINETKEFATVELCDGSIYTIDRRGNPVRKLADPGWDDGSRDHPGVIGPLLQGFSGAIFDGPLPSEFTFDEQKKAWTGFNTDPALAAKLRFAPDYGDLDVLREKIRFIRALQLAEDTWLERNEDVSGYDYIGIDGNYDLYLNYPERPPVVVGGFDDPFDIVMDLKAILRYDDKDLWGKYDYVDLHVPGYARGVDLGAITQGPLKKWSGPDEAARVADWKIRSEIDYRLKE